MSERKECADYLSCYHAEESGLNSSECFFWLDEVCEYRESVHSGQSCPWAGRRGQAAGVSAEIGERVAGGR